MDPTFLCPGCTKNFLKARYRRSHLTQTTNAACIAIRNTIFTSEGELHPPPLPQPTPEVPVCPTPLPNRHNPNAHVGPSPGYDGAGDQGGEEGDFDDADSDTQTENSDPGLEERNRSPTPSEFLPLPEEPHIEMVKVFFPGQRAGEVLSEGIPTMKEHENNLGGQTSNPYSPFNSEIDWEVAKWARLRGPSATSFDELLEINGVRPIHALQNILCLHLLAPQTAEPVIRQFKGDEFKTRSPSRTVPQIPSKSS